MPTSTILILTGIIAAFALYGVTLAWAERRTGRLPKQSREAPATMELEDVKRAA
jgi:hypothetical protein